MVNRDLTRLPNASSEIRATDFELGRELQAL